VIALAVLLAAVSAFLAVTPIRRVSNGPPAVRPAPHRRDRIRLGTGAVLAGLAGVFALAGPTAGVLCTAVAVIAGTAARVMVQRRRMAVAREHAAGISRACTVLAAEMELGKIPSSALRVAAEDCPELLPAAAASAIGAEVVEVWQSQGAEPGGAGLRTLARAWQVAVTTGAPLGPSLETVAAALRADEEVDRLVAGELAAPRLTGLLLALLPLGGVGLGYLIGGDPIGFLTGTPWGWGCLLTGCLLACAGVLWTEHLGGQG
jgi:tight adherence protein B